jgi:hypothetical protein
LTRPRAILATAALLALIVTATASAHQGNPNYRSIVGHVMPSVPGIKLQVLNFDDRLELDNASGRTVLVRGYENEPYARVMGNGTVQVNRRSPAYYLNNDRTGEAKVPATANPKAPPQWQVIDRSGRFQWHDHRIHWMGAGRPSMIKDTSKRTKVFAWSVPLQVGASKGAISGTLWWQPKPGGRVGAIVALVAFVLAGGIATFVVRRRRAGGAEARDMAEAW